MIHFSGMSTFVPGTSWHVISTYEVPLLALRSIVYVSRPFTGLSLPARLYGSLLPGKNRNRNRQDDPSFLRRVFLATKYCVLPRVLMGPSRRLLPQVISHALGIERMQVTATKALEVNAECNAKPRATFIGAMKCPSDCAFTTGAGCRR